MRNLLPDARELAKGDFPLHALKQHTLSGVAEYTTNAATSMWGLDPTTCTSGKNIVTQHLSDEEEEGQPGRSHRQHLKEIRQVFAP